MLKSAGVVIGSYLLSIVLVIATDPLLSLLFPGDFVAGRVPSNTALLASTACFAVVSILCAWVCARFSPNRPSRHVLWFLILGEAMGAVATVLNWSNGWPHWYGISWLLLWPVACGIALTLPGKGREKASAATA